MKESEKVPFQLARYFIKSIGSNWLQITKHTLKL